MDYEQVEHLKIVYFYATDDREHFVSFHRHLTWIRKNKLIEEYREMLAGANVQEQAKVQLENADIIILLISSFFNDLDDYNNDEMIVLLKKHVQKGVRVWPIIVRPVYWERSTFSDFEVFWGKGKVVTDYTAEVAYRKIAEQIDWEIKLLLSEKWVNVGDQMRHQKRWEEALQAYDHSLRHISGYPPALFGRGLTLRRSDHLEEAKQCFESALSFKGSPLQQRAKGDPYYGNQQIQWSLMCCKGDVQLELGNIQESIRLFQEVCQKMPSPTTIPQEIIYMDARCGEIRAYLSLGNQTSDGNYYLSIRASYDKAQGSLLNHHKYLSLIAETDIRLGDLVRANRPLNYPVRLQSSEYYEHALQLCRQVTECYPDYAPAYLGLGNVYFRLQCYEKALVAYEDSIKIDEYEGQAYYGKAKTLLELNRPQDALFFFEQAISLEQGNANYSYGRGLAYASLEQYHLALDNYQEAQRYGLQSLDLTLSHAEALQGLAEITLASGQRDRADRYHREAFQVYMNVLRQGNPKKDKMYVCIGKIYSAFENWENALHYYRKSINIASNGADVYLEIGKVQVKLKKSDAFTYFEYAYELCQRPGSRINNADIQLAYGDAYFYRAKQSNAKDAHFNQKKALNYYRESAQIRENVKAYIGMGKTYAALHYNEEAIHALNQALRLNSHIAGCYFLQANCYYKLGNFAEACHLYRATLDRGFETASVRHALGDTLIAMKRYNEAIDVLDHIISHGGDESAHIYCSKAKALSASERYEEAIRCFEQAKSIDTLICSVPDTRHMLDDVRHTLDFSLHHHPRNASAYKQKGDVLMLLGEGTSEAIKLYTQAIAHGEGSADVYYSRGKAYLTIKDYKKALIDFRTTLALDPNHQNAQQGKTEAEMRVPQQSTLLEKIALWLGLLK